MAHDEQRYTGQVTRWLDRGFGYLRVDGTDGQRPLFVHASDVVGRRGRIDLVAGLPVEFEIGADDQGRPRARDVVVLEPVAT